MSHSHLKIINIKNDATYIEKFCNSLKEIETSLHRNSKNYLDLQNKLDQFDAFHLLMDERNDSIVCFAGLQSNIYPDKHIRILSRYYKAPDYRSKGLEATNHLGTKFLLPKQIKFAEKIGKKAIFISMEPRRDLGRVKTLLEAVQENSPKPWILLDGLHNTCRVVSGSVNQHNSCWQRILLYGQVDETGFKLPRK